MKRKYCICSVIIFLLMSMAAFGGNYNGFKVSVYTRAQEVEKMKNTHWLNSTWTMISSQLKVDKVYLEIHRDLLIIPDAILELAKKGHTWTFV